MEIRAPQSSGSGGGLGGLLLQLAVSASGQATQTIDSIGARLASLAESRRDREFTLQRDEAGRDFQREQTTQANAITDKRQAAEQQFTVARDAEGRAFQMLLEQRRHELGVEDMELQADLRAKAERQQALAEQEQQQVRNQRISEVLRVVPGLVARQEAPRYAFSARFSKFGDGPDVYARLRSQLEADGHSAQDAADIATGLMQPIAVEWVDRSQFADALSALTSAGDDNPTRTLESIVGKLPYSEADARQRVAEHVDQVIGSRIGSTERTLTGALEIPGAQAGRSSPIPMTGPLAELNITPATLDEDLANQWGSSVGGGTWDTARTLRPEFWPGNWVFDNGAVRPREGLDKSILERMTPGSAAASFMGTLVGRIPAASLSRSSSTSVPLTPTQATKGVSSTGAAVTPAPVIPGATISREEAVQSNVEGLLNLGPFRSQFGDPQLPRF